jgi:hypothetical protein
LQARFRKKRENDCTGWKGAIPKVVNAGSTTTSGTISVASQDGFNGTASLTCSIPGGSRSCNVSSYTVHENGTSIGAPTSTSLAVTGLLPPTPQAPDIYYFQIAASDAAGIFITQRSLSDALSHSITVTLLVPP